MGTSLLQTSANIPIHPNRRRNQPTDSSVWKNTANDDFHVKVARTLEEIKALLEVGFEYVVEKDGLLFFRKENNVRN